MSKTMELHIDQVGNLFCQDDWKVPDHGMITDDEKPQDIL